MIETVVPVPTLPAMTVGAPGKPEPQKRGLCYEGTVLVYYGKSVLPSQDLLGTIRDERFEKLCEGLPH